MGGFFFFPAMLRIQRSGKWRGKTDEEVDLIDSLQFGLLP